MVAPLTGRPAPLGEPLSFVLRALAPCLEGITHGGRRLCVRIAMRDSRSEPEAARQAVRELAEQDRVSLVLTMAGTQVLPAVTSVCEELGVPCVSATFPWQAFGAARGGDPLVAFDWTYHFAWGLDGIAGVFADLWERLEGEAVVSCLGNDGLQGRLSRDEQFGFAAAATRRGHRLIDPGGYREPAGDFTAHLQRIRGAGVDVVTSAATAADLALFLRQARESGVRPQLMTCSRWLTYPHAAVAHSPEVRDELTDMRVGTLVYWSPGHPYRSSHDGSSCKELADAYQQATGKPWLQPPRPGSRPGRSRPPHAGHHGRPPPTGRPSPTPCPAPGWTPSSAPWIGLRPDPQHHPAAPRRGQWQPGDDGPRLQVVTNSRVPDVPATANLITAG